MTNAGQVYNFASDRELEKWSLATNTANSISDKEDNAMSTLGQGHVLYDWFLEDCFSKVKAAIGNNKIKLIFSMLINEVTPFGIHTDSYHTLKFPNRKAAISLLIPLSVDNDPLKCNQTHTIIFNEANREYAPRTMTGKTWDFTSLPDTTDLPDSAVNIYNKHLSHNKPDLVKHLTIQGEYQWARGSLIWWDSINFHDSDNFLANGFTSKQALVLHTYYDD